MPVQDRTTEFRSCVESIRSRSSIPSRNTESRQRLLQSHGKEGKSEFARMASAIGKDISSTTIKLGKLAQCEQKATDLRNVLMRMLGQWRNEKHCSMTDQWR